MVREELMKKLEEALFAVLSQKQYEPLSQADIMTVIGKVLRNGGG